ncbi:uncharacterized protein LOC129589773 [Paramacrobiotus metropolitanus]|uniref:uncharacterized protein LOC129589773 n=1 Tax=Paramacrobiotus metropolitanus TaxID=2943436 RepID=UPI0024464FCB|nr:uncharacterized protein LOC129589773 [Paramacrobiotus metropolitanus]
MLKLVLALTIVAAALADTKNFKPNCNHETTGFAEFNTAYCKFYSCDGGQQLRLECRNAGVTDGNSMNNHVRDVLANYYRRATQPGGTQPLLHLQLYGRLYNNGRNEPFTVNSGLLGLSAALIHRMSIDTHFLTSISSGSTFWSTMPNLKIVEITVQDTNGNPPPTFFAGADALESLHLDLGAARDYNFTSQVIDLKSLQCFNLRGTRFVCDCHMMEFMRRSPAWRMTTDYENPLLDDDIWQCGTHTGAKCGATIPSHNGKALNNFNFPDCPHIPFVSTILGAAPLAGSQVSCDYENLRIKLRNMGIVNHLSFRLNGDADPRCGGTLKAGVIHFDVPASECGTNVTINRQAKSVLYQNKVVITRKTSGTVITNPSAQTVSGKVVPIECRLNQYGDLSQQFQAPYQIYPKQHWDGRVRIKMDVLPSTSIWGGFAFDLTLDTTAAGNWSMSVEDCWATPTNNPSDALRYDIIKSGCFVDPTVHMESQSGDQYIRQTYTLDEFQFSSTLNAQVFIHCEVEPCQKGNGYCKLTQEERCAALHTTPIAPSTVATTTTSEPATFTVLTTIETTTVLEYTSTEHQTDPTTTEKLTEPTATVEHLNDSTGKDQPAELLTVPTLEPVPRTEDTAVDQWELLGRGHRFRPDPYVRPYLATKHRLVGHIIPGSVTTKRR